MPYLSTSQEWLHQSSLLLQARPRTAKITTKYTIHRQQPPKKRRKLPPSSTDSGQATKKDGDDDTVAITSPSQPQAPRGSLILKTYDPESGVCLKYKTDKAAEVGRLVASLGQLGRLFCGLNPEEVPDPGSVGQEGGAVEPLPMEADATTAAAAGRKPDAAGSEPSKGEAKGGTSNKKRKKGKR